MPQSDDNVSSYARYEQGDNRPAEVKFDRKSGQI